MVGERDVELLLDSRLVESVALRKAEQWLVARVAPERMANRVARRDVDTEAAEALEELRVVGLEESVQVHPPRVSPPAQEQVEDIAALKP